MLTFDPLMQAYKELLEANPGKALIIGPDSVACLDKNGYLYGAELDDGRVLHDGFTDFHEWAFDQERGCWDCETSQQETLGYIQKPVFVDAWSDSETPRRTHDLLAGIGRDASSLEVAAKALLREALDNVEVHPCDEGNDTVAAKQLSPSLQALLKALTGYSA
ncbi:hypothetical protein ACI2KR_31380 [Pseudomonas luteola]